MCLFYLIFNVGSLSVYFLILHFISTSVHFSIVTSNWTDILQLSIMSVFLCPA